MPSVVRFAIRYPQSSILYPQIRVEHIAEIQPLVHGDCRIVMSNGDPLTLSRRYRKRLVSLLDERQLLPGEHLR